MSETAQDPIPDDKENINGVHKLSKESTQCNFDYVRAPGSLKTLATTGPFAPGTPTPPRLDTVTAGWAAGRAARGTSSTA